MQTNLGIGPPTPIVVISETTRGDLSQLTQCTVMAPIDVDDARDMFNRVVVGAPSLPTYTHTEYIGTEFSEYQCARMHYENVVVSVERFS